jgi:thiamine-phosphate pyrophosphorylase
MIDWPRGLYGIADASYGDPVAAAQLLVEAGVSTVQLRAKTWAHGRVLDAAHTIHAICQSRAVRFVVNDHADIAAEIGAAGLHLGQEDLSIAEARRVFSGRIGLSTHDLEQVRRANADGADYIGFGPVFPSGTRQLVPPLGASALARAVQASAVPVVAIGGIGPERIETVITTGVQAWAVIGAIFTAENPDRALQLLQGP